MLGLLGWIIMVGAGIKQAADTQYISDTRRSEAIHNNKLYYTDAKGNYWLTESNQQVWLSNCGGDVTLVDKNKRIVYNLNQLKRDEQTQEAIKMARMKAKELGITDRNWLWVEDELGWRPKVYPQSPKGSFDPYISAERFDLTTGKRFTIQSYCLLGKKYNVNGKVTLYPESYEGQCDPITNIWYTYYSPIFNFFKVESGVSGSRFKHITLDNWGHYFERISLTEYLLTWKAKLNTQGMNFLLETGIIKSKNIKIEGYDHLVTTDVEDIISIDEDKFKKIEAEMEALFEHHDSRYRLADYEYKSVLDE